VFIEFIAPNKFAFTSYYIPQTATDSLTIEYVQLLLNIVGRRSQQTHQTFQDGALGLIPHQQLNQLHSCKIQQITLVLCTSFLLSFFHPENDVIYTIGLDTTNFLHATSIDASILFTASFYINPVTLNHTISVPVCCSFSPYLIDFCISKPSWFDVARH